MSETLTIGLVSVSDRASQGVYEDKGLPTLKEWLAGAITTPFNVVERLIADDQATIEATLMQLVDETGCGLVLTTVSTANNNLAMAA